MEELITCTQCGADNPPGQRFCYQCGSSLGPSRPAQVSALPVWLQEDDSPVDTPAPVVATRPRDDLPDWLRDMTDTDEQARGRSDATGPDQLPPRPPAGNTQPVPNADLPDWLRVAMDEPGSETAVSVQAEQHGLPPWLAELDDGDTNAPAPRTETWELPVWLREANDVGPSINQVAEAKSPAEYQVPAWLHDDDSPPPVPLDHTASGGQGQTQPVATGTGDPSALPETTDPSALPAWLRDEHLPAADQSADALPSWLQEMSAKPTPGGTATTGKDEPQDSAPSTGAGNSLPGWLLDGDASPTSTASPATDPGTLPSWLVEPVPESAAMSREVAEDEDVHDAAHGQHTPGPVLPAGSWPPSADAIGQSGASSAGSRAPSAAATERLPAWLQEIGEPDTSATPNNGGWLTDTGPEPAAPSTSEKLPHWLHDLERPSPEASAVANGRKGVEQAARPRAGGGGNIARIYPVHENGVDPGGAGGTDLPPWLADLSPSPNVESAPVPSWLETPRREYERGGGLNDGRGAPDFPGELDLPEWLREESPVATAPAPAPPVPSWLYPADPDTAVATEMAAVAAPAMIERAPVQRAPERVAATQLLERLVVEPAPEPLPQVAPLRRARLILWLQIAAFVILIAAILIALLGPRLPLRLGTPVPSFGGAAVAGRLAALQPATPVLVAYEWDARRAAEMIPLEEAVMAHLVERRVPLMLMTTEPQGAVLSRQRANMLKDRRDGFYDQVGLGHVDLGFKPGGELALARMNTTFSSLLERDWAGRDLRREPVVMNTMCGGTDGAACNLDRLGLIVVLADESDDVRAWVEQVGSGHPNVPVTFVAPAEVVPQIRPYFTQANMGLVAGLDGAYELQALTGMGDERLSRRVDATAVGSAAFGLLVLAGMLPALWSGRRARSSGKESIWDR